MSLPRVKPGDVLGGKYRVERVLGAGGMGVVVAARHLDLGQSVALKFMLPEAMADPTHAERFLREAKAAVQLKSVHTARVLDVGRLNNDEPFMVMEYLDGRDLDAELVARQRLPEHEAVDFILQASEALAEAHGLGMVHRDVKLKNMFLTTTVDGRPLVKVLDFGLAKQLGGPGDVSLTATNSVFGSPQYMSPEQMRSAKDVDYRSDIWSLGVCLYELLTGHLPFDAGGVAEICALVLKDPPPPPSTYLPTIPVELERVILQALEKDPALRYASIGDFAIALQPFATDEGSARRILNVQHAVGKTNTEYVTSSANNAWDAGPKTLNAWDSGGPTARRATHLTTRQMGTALATFMVLAITGITLLLRYRALHHSSTPEIAAASTGDAVEARPSPPPPAAAPPPPPPPAAGAAQAEPTPGPAAPGAGIGVATPPGAAPAAPPQPAAGVGTIIGASPDPTETTPARTRRAPSPPPPHPAGVPAAKPAAPPAPPASSVPPKPRPKSGPGSGYDYM